MTYPKTYGGKGSETIRVLEIAHHRNGVMGDPFYAVRFTYKGQNMLAIVFEPDAPEIRTAVLSIDQLPTEGVAFMRNSWRGDQFHHSLKQAIKDYNGGFEEIERSHRDRVTDIYCEAFCVPFGSSFKVYLEAGHPPFVTGESFEDAWEKAWELMQERKLT